MQTRKCLARDAKIVSRYMQILVTEYNCYRGGAIKLPVGCIIYLFIHNTLQAMNGVTKGGKTSR